MVNDNREFACLPLVLDSPADCRELIRQVLGKIRENGEEVAQAGRICNLLQVWLKAFELEKGLELEERVKRLEERL